MPYSLPVTVLFKAILYLDTCAFVFTLLCAEQSRDRCVGSASDNSMTSVPSFRLPSSSTTSGTTWWRSRTRTSRCSSPDPRSARTRYVRHREAPGHPAQGHPGSATGKGGQGGTGPLRPDTPGSVVQSQGRGQGGTGPPRPDTPGSVAGEAGAGRDRTTRTEAPRVQPQQGWGDREAPGHPAQTPRVQRRQGWRGIRVRGRIAPSAVSSEQLLLE